MYPQHLNSSITSTSAGTDHCLRCHFRQDLCLCSQVPRIESRACFHLLVHEREVSKPTNTGHLLLNSIGSSEFDIWSRTEAPPALMSRLSSSLYQPLVLFPADQVGEQTKVLKKIPEGVTPLFILLDATWQEAAKMYRKSPYLHDLPVLSLAGGIESRYPLRRNQKTGGLSTVEVGQLLLEELGEQPSAISLESYFQTFLQHYEAQRSNRSL